MLNETGGLSGLPGGRFLSLSRFIRATWPSVRPLSSYGVLQWAQAWPPAHFSFLLSRSLSLSRSMVAFGRGRAQRRAAVAALESDWILHTWDFPGVCVRLCVCDRQTERERDRTISVCVLLGIFLTSLWVSDSSVCVVLVACRLAFLSARSLFSAWQSRWWFALCTSMCVFVSEKYLHFREADVWGRRQGEGRVTQGCSRRFRSWGTPFVLTAFQAARGYIAVGCIKGAGFCWQTSETSLKVLALSAYSNTVLLFSLLKSQCNIIVEHRFKLYYVMLSMLVYRCSCHGWAELARLQILLNKILPLQKSKRKWHKVGLNEKTGWVGLGNRWDRKIVTGGWWVDFFCSITDIQVMRCSNTTMRFP